MVKIHPLHPFSSWFCKTLKILLSSSSNVSSLHILQKHLHSLLPKNNSDFCFTPLDTLKSFADGHMLCCHLMKKHHRLHLGRYTLQAGSLLKAQMIEAAEVHFWQNATKLATTYIWHIQYSHLRSICQIYLGLPPFILQCYSRNSKNLPVYNYLR